MLHQVAGWFIPLQDNNASVNPPEPILTEDGFELLTEAGDPIFTE